MTMSPVLNLTQKNQKKSQGLKSIVNFLVFTLFITLSTEVIAQQTTETNTKQSTEVNKKLLKTKTESQMIVSQTETVLQEQNKTLSQDEAAKVDEEITNARMRADLGAAKKYSFNSSLSYNGSTLADPTNSLRPNIISGATSFDDSTSLSGSIGGTMRLDKNNAYGFSAALNIYTPFAGDWTRDEIENPTKPNSDKVKRINISNPTITYTKSRRIGEIQSVSKFSLTGYTEPVFINQSGLVGNLGLSQTLAMQADNWTVGTYINAFTFLYKSKLDQTQSDRETLLRLGLIPFIEYQFNNKIGWRAVFNYFAWDYLKNASKQGQASYSFNTPQNSTGVMFSVSRDVWIYPNVQFLPFNVRSDLTNWGISTIINL